MSLRLRDRFVNLWRGGLHRSRDESGQSIIVLAFAFLGLVAMLGLALDLGLVYIERVRLKRAIDASVLGGVVELPFEEDAAARAMEFLELNGYDLSNAQVVIRGCVRDVRDYYDAGPIFCGSPGCGDGDINQLINAGLDDSHPPYTYTNPPNPTSFFEINTLSYQDDPINACNDASTPPVYGTANKLGVTGTVFVNMNFMQFFGFGEVPVTDSAIAQNVDNLDVVIVFDRSGSMEFDPVCLGCWKRTETAADHENDTPRYSGYYTYPDNGTAYHLFITDTLITSACATNPPPSETYRTFGSYKYMIIEAELYSANNSVVDTAFRESGKGYWAIQRGVRIYSDGSTPAVNATSVDGGGMYVAHHPDITFYPGTQQYGQFYTLGDATSGNAPRLDYDFSFAPGEWGGGNAYVWVRVYASPNVIGSIGPKNDNGAPDHNTMYWQIEDLTDPGNSTPIQQNNDAQVSTWGQDEWTWVRLGSVNDTTHQYRLHIWAGSSGYGIDRIIITNNPSSSGNGSTGCPSALGGACTADVTAGSASRAACDPCNPIYGLTVGPGTPYPTCTFFSTPVTSTNNLLNPIWSDEEAPLRTAKEAVKTFIQRLDPQFDQVGLVTYNSSATKASQLECLKHYGLDACVKGSNPISFTNVLRAVEDIEARSSTNISDGMKQGLEVLGFDPYNEGGNAGSYGRGGAASKVMILLTDGVPDPSDLSPGGDCTSGWYPNSSDPNRINTRYNGSEGYDCMLWFAEDARAHGVSIYVIGLGYGVDSELLKEVAERGNGEYYFSASGADLDLIFDEILQNIYVRLIR